jgi:hypothetical protein
MYSLFFVCVELYLRLLRGVLIINYLVYFFYYVTMKYVHKESVRWFVWVLTVCKFVIWVHTFFTFGILFVTDFFFSFVFPHRDSRYMFLKFPVPTNF